MNTTELRAAITERIETTRLGHITIHGHTAPSEIIARDLMPLINEWTDQIEREAAAAHEDGEPDPDSAYARGRE